MTRKKRKKKVKEMIGLVSHERYNPTLTKRMTDKNIITKKRFNYASAITLLLCVLISVALFNIGRIAVGNVLYDLETNCKTCSVFDNCPYTDQELLDQEYGNNPYCRDMGIYEIKFKFFTALFYGGALMFLFFGILQFFSSRRQKTSGKTY